MRMRDLPLVGEAERDLKAMFVQELAADHIPEATEHVPMRVPRDSRPSVRQGGGAECVCVCVCVGGSGGYPRHSDHCISRSQSSEVVSPVSTPERT